MFLASAVQIRFTEGRHAKPIAAKPRSNGQYARAYELVGSVDGNGGARRNRTDDLFNAIEALSQLSYGPTGRRRTGELRHAVAARAAL